MLIIHMSHRGMPRAKTELSLLLFAKKSCRPCRPCRPRSTHLAGPAEAL